MTVFLFCSGQVHIISSDHDESDEDFVAAASPPRIDHVPNTKELQVNIGVSLNKSSLFIIQPHILGYQYNTYNFDNFLNQFSNNSTNSEPIVRFFIIQRALILITCSYHK